jgi:hypothetical protein
VGKSSGGRIRGAVKPRGVGHGNEEAGRYGIGCKQTHFSQIQKKHQLLRGFELGVLSLRLLP